MTLPAARNAYKQREGSNDCGFAVWQALEQCMKICRGEGDFTVYPDPRGWRKTLHTFLEKLEAIKGKKGTYIHKPHLLHDKDEFRTSSG